MIHGKGTFKTSNYLALIHCNFYLFFSMNCDDMFLEMSFLAKSGHTDLASERLLLIVDCAKMFVKQALRSRAVLTLGTTVRSLL